MHTVKLANFMLFLSTLSLRRATYWPCVYVVGRSISIHALLAESDAVTSVARVATTVISIHALLAESDIMHTVKLANFMLFLSTLSLRRATQAESGGAAAFGGHFYPRSPCGERRQMPLTRFFRGNFYPRSPCGERPEAAHERANSLPFLSTLSLRRATNCTSIGRPKRLYFYPRSPCGERHDGLIASANFCHFYPRSPCGERLYLVHGQRPSWGISIHALLAESDLPTDGLLFIDGRFLSTLSLRRATANLRQNRHQRKHFYPRSPCGERQRLGLLGWLRVLISIHALLAESDFGRFGRFAVDPSPFLSTLSLRRATSQQPPGTTRTTYFYPRSPCGERQV